jgi:hypothetical protein
VKLEPAIVAISLVLRRPYFYISRVADTEKEVCNLIEDGFDFVCDFQDHRVFRKRK